MILRRNLLQKTRRCIEKKDKSLVGCKNLKNKSEEKMIKFQQLLLLLLLHCMLMLMKRQKVILEEVLVIGVVIAMRVLLHPIHLLYLRKQRRKTFSWSKIEN